MTEQEQTPAEPATPEPTPYQVSIDVDALTWGDMELFEDLEAKIANGQRPTFGELRKLVMIFFGWTEARAKQIRLSETSAILAAIRKAQGGAINPTSGSS